jgi:hypothetical protein
LHYPDYPKFKGMALSEPGVMNPREYDLLTVRDDWRKYNGNKEISDSLHYEENKTKKTRMSAIRRTPTLIHELYKAGLINLELASLLGPDPALPHAAERQRNADRALQDIQSLARTDDDAAYRQAVNAAVRRAFALDVPANGPKTRRLRRLPTDPHTLIALARQEHGEAYITALREALKEA